MYIMNWKYINYTQSIQSSFPNKTMFESGGVQSTVKIHNKKLDCTGLKSAASDLKDTVTAENILLRYSHQNDANSPDPYLNRA